MTQNEQKTQTAQTADKKINTVILGASGYTGAELMRWLPYHPAINIIALSGESQAGKTIGQVYPHLRHSGLPTLQKIAEIDFTNVDLVFCCLPHGTTQEVIATLLTEENLTEQGEARSGGGLRGQALHSNSKMRIIDLSADFRLKNTDTYEQWYGKPHQAKTLQAQAVYGLTEANKEAIKSARLVANPGCYPTGAQLPLLPLMEAGLISTDNIIIDAKSGVTGAGRKVAQAFLYTEVNDSLMAYGIAQHRHIPEIEQGLAGVHGGEVSVRFTPHLVPMSRGILSTIYVDLAEGKSADDLRAHLQSTYHNDPFIHILPEGELPTTGQVKGTNDCLISVCKDRISGKAILVSAIDNLAKGSSSQALHNMNLMFDLPEQTGLAAVALFP